MRKFLAVCALFSIFATSVLAAPASPKAKPAGSTKIYGAVEAKDGFLGGRLFDVLDSVGGTGTWMEWDVNGVRDPSVAKILDPILNSQNKPKMIWVITEREKPLLSVLLPKGAGEVIVLYERSLRPMSCSGIINKFPKRNLCISTAQISRFPCWTS